MHRCLPQNSKIADTYIAESDGSVDNNGGYPKEEENHATHKEKSTAHREVKLSLHRKQRDRQTNCCRDSNCDQDDLCIIVTENSNLQIWLSF